MKNENKPLHVPPSNMENQFVDGDSLPNPDFKISGIEVDSAGTNIAIVAATGQVLFKPVGSHRVTCFKDSHSNTKMIGETNYLFDGAGYKMSAICCFNHSLYIIALYNQRCRETSLNIIGAGKCDAVQYIQSEMHLHRREINQVLYLEENVLTSSGDCVIAWRWSRDARKLQLQNYFRPKSGLVHELCVHGDNILISMRSRTDLMVLRRRTLEPFRSIDLDLTSINQISSESDIFVVCGRQARKSIVELRSSLDDTISRFESSSFAVVSCSLLDGNNLVVLTDDGTVRIVELSSNRVIASTAGHLRFAVTMFRAKSNLLAVWCRTSYKILRISELENRNCESGLRFFDSPDCPLTSTVLERPIDRVQMYQRILGLPLNERAFAFLETSPDCNSAKRYWESAILGHQNENIVFAFKSEITIHRLIQLCALFSSWLGTNEPPRWLPNFLFPFAKLFGKKMIFAFELSAWVSVNSVRPLFQSQIAVVGHEEQLFRESDLELYSHISQFVEAGSWIADNLVVSLLTEVTEGNIWLKILDELVMRSRRCCYPRFWFRTAVGMLSVNREEILTQVTNLAELNEWAKRIHSVDPHRLLPMDPKTFTERLWVIPENAVRYPEFVYYDN